ncbi:tripartite tricarboxylate transporter substrate binding protein [Roseomonas sp. AR75]|uniref:tripartite tricarboxylate transporter substrate binding protein n=1 Tax=Roseomonas sp. AR75 TaxID=2562311 RepID=UPI0010C021FB|nr:tripartite tricarboxylate transporter substrate binding protein [Roseomonas sp. AR75]
MRRRSLALTPLALLARPAWAQADAAANWPPRPVRVIVPFAAGASSDTLARIVCAKLGDALGGSIVVENRAGAGGLIASQTVARAAPDGTTLLWGGGTAITVGVMQRDPGFDVLKDFTPVVTIAENPALLCVRPAAAWKTIAELIAGAKAAPAGGLRYGSGGVGTPAHMAAAALLKSVGAEGTHVPYRGANQAALAVEQGEVDFAFAISNIALPRAQQGAIRVLVTTGSRRMPAFPDMPTLAETIPDGPVIISGSSLVGPAGIPPAITQRIHDAVRRIVTEDAALREALTREGGSITLSDSPAAYAAEWPREVARLQRLIAFSGARVE